MFNYRKNPLTRYLYLFMNSVFIRFLTHQPVLVQVQRWYVIAVYTLSPNKHPGAYLKFIYTLAI